MIWYRVGITSGETLFYPRERWAEMDWFYVEVEYDLESP